MVNRNRDEKSINAQSIKPYIFFKKADSQHHSYLPSTVGFFESLQGWPSPFLDGRPVGTGRGVGGPAGPAHLSGLHYIPNAPGRRRALGPVKDHSLSD